MTEQQKNARFALCILFAVNMMNFFDRQIAGALGAPIKAEFGMSDAAFGFANTVFTLMYAAVGIPIGRLADTRNRKRIVAWGVTVWSLFTAAGGATWSYLTFVLARCGVGIGEATCAPTSQSLIGDLYPPTQRAKAMSLFMLGLPIGLFLAYQFAGFVGSRWGWRPAFFLACIPGLIIAVLTLRIKEPARGTTEAHVGLAAPPVDKPFRSIFVIPTLWGIVASGLLLNFNSYTANTYQTMFLMRFHHLGLQEANLLSSLSLGMAGVLGLWIGGVLGDRLRTRRDNGRLLLAAVTMAIASPCCYFALELPAGSTAGFTALMATFTAMTFVYYSTVYSALQDVVEPRLRATAVSVYFFAQYVFGGAFGTTITGALSDHYAVAAQHAAGAAQMAPEFQATGLHQAMYLIPILAIICALVLFVAASTVSRDMRRMQDRLRTIGPEVTPVTTSL